MKNLVILMLAALFLSACGSTPRVRYYQLSQPQGEPAAQGDLIIGVEPFLTDAGYDDQRMVYRTGDYRLDYYHYHRWSATPGVMISDYVRGALSRSGLFRSVLTGFTADATGLVGGRIVAMEEIDKSESEWEAHVSLELYLRDARDGKLVWSQTMTDTEQLTEQTPEGLAAAMSTILDRIVTKAAPEIQAQAQRLVPQQ